jgi:hypothetical protein
VCLLGSKDYVVDINVFDSIKREPTFAEKSNGPCPFALLRHALLQDV